MSEMATKLSEPKKDGRRERGDRARALILERAMEVASTEGLEGLTFGGLADDLGLSKGNITVLFGDKESLQIATLDAAIQRFVDVIVTPALRKPSPLARVKALCEGWYDYVEAKTFAGGCLLYATTHEYRARPGALRDRAVHYMNMWKKRLGSELKAAVAAGEIPKSTDVRQTVFILSAYKNAAHVAVLTGDDDSFQEARRLMRAQFAALKK